MDNGVDVHRSSTTNPHAADWISPAPSSSSSSVLAVRTALIFVLLSDVILRVAAAADAVQTTPHRLPGTSLSAVPECLPVHLSVQRNRAMLRVNENKQRFLGFLGLFKS